MPEDSHTFATARVRLEEIVTQVRKKDTSLEKSLDLLEEGVRLANQCTELIDHADWEAAGGGNGDASAANESASADTSTDAEKDAAVESEDASLQSEAGSADDALSGDAPAE